MALSGFAEWVQQLNFDKLLYGAILIAASLICIMLHEMAHGLTALWLGDNTAKRAHRLSFNPLRHIDPIGLLMMAVLRFGWAKPVPVDMRNFKNPKAGMVLTALAGPLCNVLLTFVALLLRALVIAWMLASNWEWLEYLVIFFEYMAVLSAGLAVFNIFPIPPLDGSKIVFGLLPDRMYWKLMRYERYGIFLTMGLLLLGVLDRPLMFLRDGMLDFMTALIAPMFQALLHAIL